MRHPTLVAAAIGAACAASPGSAQQVNGGDLSLTYSTFTDNTDVNALALEGAIEFGFARNLALQLDLGNRRFDVIGDDATNVTLHGIYRPNDQTALGLFLGIDSLSGYDATFYGLEAGYEMAAFDIEGYLALGEDSGIDGVLMGLAGQYAIAPSMDLGLSLERADFDGGVDVTRIGLGGTYRFDNGVSVTAEVGTADLDAGTVSASEPFVAIGARYAFGPEGGTTFGRRGLVRLIPGL